MEFICSEGQIIIEADCFPGRKESAETKQQIHQQNISNAFYIFLTVTQTLLVLL